MKHIGILGHSAEGAALCFLTACHEGARRLGAHLHPNITLSIEPMGASLDAWERFPRIKSGVTQIRAMLSRIAARLAAAGCDFFVCPDNTAHIALETEGEPLPLPGLHIAEIVADEAIARGCKKVGLLGTKWTMSGPVYPRAFSRRNLALSTPAPQDAVLVDRIIFDELCNGILTDSARREYVRVVAAFKEEGCDAVALSCTEIPLLVTPEDSPLPTLDSTRLLAKTAVEAALGARPAPTWRGGPILEAGERP